MACLWWWSAARGWADYPHMADGCDADTVSGNEAGDADSIVSSICYAYWLHHHRPQQQQEVVAPLLPIARSELSLRTETVRLMERAQLHTR